MPFTRIRLPKLRPELWTIAFTTLLVQAALAEPNFDAAKLEFIDNGTIKLGVSPDLGGAITYLSTSGSDRNVINNFDWGRQVQMSFFAGPVPYHEKGQKPNEHWKHIGWNPIQAGDDHGNGSKVTGFKKTETSIYVKCIPMQWPLNNIPGECTYEAFIKLKGNAVQVRCRLNNARSDKTQYAGRHQELPAVYTNGEYYRLMTYRGDKPFAGDKVVQIPKKQGGEFPWGYWLATENWAALVNDKDWGLGIYKPDSSLFIGGFDHIRTGSWETFLKTHWDVMASIDFTTVEVWTKSGLTTFYLLFVMELKTRRVNFAGCTTNPNEAWM